MQRLSCSTFIIRSFPYTSLTTTPTVIRYFRTSHVTHPFWFQTCCCYGSRRIQAAIKKDNNKYRVSKKKQVVLIDQGGNNLGTMTMDMAVHLALAQGMELIDVSKKGRGQEGEHVCRMMSKKEIWDKKKKERESNKKDPQNVTKDIKIATSISDHDIDTKLKQIESNLDKRHKVQLLIQPKLKRYQWEIDELREAEHTKQKQLLKNIIKRLEDVGSPVSEEKWTGKHLVIVIKKSI